jgi:hypothetical protein
VAFIRVSRQFITHTKFDENKTSHLTDVERLERTDRKTEFSSLFCFRLAHRVQSKFAFALSYNKSGRMDTVPWKSFQFPCPAFTTLRIIVECVKTYRTADIGAPGLREVVIPRSVYLETGCSAIGHWCLHTVPHLTTDKFMLRSTEPLLCITTVEQNRGYWFHGTGFEMYISCKRNV